MNLPLYIAKRYFFSKKSHNIINIISWISMAGIAVGTAALIIILSVFNGFEEVVISLYDSFDPDIKVVPKEGKTFIPDSAKVLQVASLQEVEALSQTLEENAGFEYDGQQYIASIKGVDAAFHKTSGLDSMLIDGKFLLKKGQAEFALCGAGVAHYLGIKLNARDKLLSVYIPKRTAEVSFNPDEAFNKGFLMPAGVFSIQQEFDEKYVIVPLEFARRMLDYTKEVSALEIKLKAGTNPDNAKAKIAAVLGNQLDVLTRAEQHAFAYKVMKAEKWAVFLILSFILVIATFNVIGSLTILIIEKKKDILVLQCLGATQKQVNQIFLNEGMLVSLVGIIIGVILGYAVCYIQQQFGIITLGKGNFVMEAYPVKMLLSDFFFIIAVVLIICYLANLLPVRWFSKRFLQAGKVSLNMR